MPYYVVLTADESIDAQRGSADPDMYEIRTVCPTTNSSHQEITNGWMGSYGDLSETALGEYETVEEARERVYRHAGGEDHLTGEPDEASLRHRYWDDDEPGTGVVERWWVRTDVAFGADGIIVDWDNGGVATGGPTGSSPSHCWTLPSATSSPDGMDGRPMTGPPSKIGCDVSRRPAWMSTTSRVTSARTPRTAGPRPRPMTATAMKGSPTASR